MMLKTVVPKLSLAVQWLQALGWPAAVGTAASILSLVMLFGPYRSSAQQLDVTQRALEFQRAAAGPTAAAGSVVSARQPGNSVGNEASFKQTPAEAIYELHRLAAASGTPIGEARYEWTASTDQSFAQLSMRFPLRVPYVDMRRFLESLLATMPNLAIKRLAIRSIRLEQQPGSVTMPGAVDADLHLVIFVAESHSAHPGGPGLVSAR